jgi:hypothetical protein
MSESKSTLEMLPGQKVLRDSTYPISSITPDASSSMFLPLPPITREDKQEKMHERTLRSPSKFPLRAMGEADCKEAMLSPPAGSPISDSAKNILIAGAGVGGCFTALKLAAVKTLEGSPEYQITLVDKNSGILRGSSDITPGRMGLGFHYVHKPTAIMYLRSTVEFQRKYSAIKDFRIGADLPTGSPVRRALQRGRYFITKDSKPSKAEILETYGALKEEYARLVREDPANKVFGEPEDFFRILAPAEYKDYVVMEKVDVGIETAECLLDWKVFRKFLIYKLTHYKNIQIVTDTTVEKITPDREACKYAVTISQDMGVSKDHYAYKVDAVVNCTWENARALNATAGLTKPEIRTNHLQGIVIVRLPDRLKNIPSAFFCMGPHVMFSNLGNGIGAMTYAPKTSMLTSEDLQVPDKINKYLNGSASVDEKFRLGCEIRKGVAGYIKGIEDAEILEVRFGIVQTLGTVDIFDHTSAFAKRDYNGISIEQLGFVTNACMKLFYGPENGEIVKDILTEHLQESTAIRKFHASLDEFPECKDSSKVGKGDLDLLRFAIPRPGLRAQIKLFDNKKLRKTILPETTLLDKVIKGYSRIGGEPFSPEVVPEVKGASLQISILEPKAPTKIKTVVSTSANTRRGSTVCDAICSFFTCGKYRRNAGLKVTPAEKPEAGITPHLKMD